MSMNQMAAVAAVSGLQHGQHQHGIVSSVDATSHLVKVLLQPQDIEVGWLPDPGMATGDLRISSPAGIGTHVLLAPVEGDGENFVIVGRIYDLVTMPPVSPQTGKPCQAGELLVMAGQGEPPAGVGGSSGPQTEGAGWFHVTPSGVFAGAGSIKLAITSAALTITAGGSSFTFTPQSLAALGAGISTDQDVTAGDVSQKEHVHINAGGSGLSGVPKQ